MELILNELSLNGQYKDLTDFTIRGLTPLTEIFRNIITDNGIAFLKNHDFYNAKIYADIHLNQLLFNPELYRNERLRQFKSYIARFQNKPFWNENQRHNPKYDYLVINDGQQIKVTGHGIAEAYARDASVISFSPSHFDSECINVHCTELDETKNIDNIRNYRHLLDVRYKKGEINHTDYIKKSFAVHFNFDEISANNGLNLINDENMNIFLSSFKNFERKDMQSIITDKGLDYKQFNKNRKTLRFFNSTQWDEGVWKFRIDQEKRCFGNFRNGVFYVWRIDLDHKLSDLG